MSRVNKTASIIMISEQKQVLFGVNQDSQDNNPKIQLIPRSNGKFGRIYFGFDDDVLEGGVNDQGLCCHLAETPESKLFFSSDKKLLTENPLTEIMATCSTVTQVIEILESHNIPGLETAQVLVADKKGEAVVFGIGKNNELTITKKTINHLILTNFNLAHPKSGNYPCSRYTIAQKMLGENSGISISAIRNILSATHVEGITATTYSLIYDLVTGDIYLFYYHDFGNGVKFNIFDALKKEKTEQCFQLRSLFKQKIKYYAEIQAKQNTQLNNIEELNISQSDKNVDISTLYISQIPNIGEVYAKQLSSIGINTVADFLENSAKPTGREKISRQSGISSKLILEWTNHFDFFRIRGIREPLIDVLEDTGIDTISELSQRNASEIYDHLVNYLNENNMNSYHLTFSEISSWIDQAKKLPRIIQY